MSEFWQPCNLGLHGPLNPDSLHTEGRKARAALDTARNRLAALWGVLKPGRSSLPPAVQNRSR